MWIALSKFGWMLAGCVLVGQLLLLLVGCAVPEEPFTPGCIPGAYVIGYNIVTVTAACDTVVGGSIIPPPPRSAS